MMVVRNSDRHVVGLATSRDLLRILAAGLKEGEDAGAIMDKCVSDFHDAHFASDLC